MAPGFAGFQVVPLRLFHPAGDDRAGEIFILCGIDMPFNIPPNTLITLK
ncbi:hypothetical protein [Thiohalophilus sp.]